MTGDSRSGPARGGLERLALAFRRLDFMDAEIRPAGWLVHFTSREAAHAIAREGFGRGSRVEDDLRHASAAASTTPGVNFAFDTDDEYSISTLVEYDFGMDACAAIMLRAPGVAMTHYDGFRQVAFHGPDATDLHVLLCPSADPDGADHDPNDGTEPHERGWTLADGRPPAGDLFAAMAMVEDASRLD